jgi:hypothetical protein
MSDRGLRQAGRIVLAAGVLWLVVAEVGYNLTAGSTMVRYGFLVDTAGGFLLLILGAIAWGLGRGRSTMAVAPVNPGLRRIGFLLFVVGVLGLIVGVIGWALTQTTTYPQVGIGTLATLGFYVAIVGAVLVAVSHRASPHRTQPSAADR